MPQALALLPAVLAAVGASKAVVIGVTLAVGVVSTLLSSVLAPKPKLPKPSDGQQNIRQQNGPRWRHYGQVRVGGQLYFLDSKDGFLHAGVILNNGPIEEFTEWWIDGEQVDTEEASSSPLVLRLLGKYIRADGTRVVTLRPQDGSANAADPALLADFSSVWTTDHKLENIAHVLAIFRSVPAQYYSNYYPNGRPEVTAVIKASNDLYDMRDGSTGWSDNPAVVIYDYMTHRDGMRLDRSLIDTASFERLANVCDEAAPTTLGTETRYRIAGSYSFEMDPSQVLERMLATCAASLYQTPEGKIGIRGGEYVPPTVIIGPEQIHEATLYRGADALARYNTLHFSYMDPAIAWKEQDGQPWIDGNLLSEAGDVPETAEFDLIMVPSHSQARRLAKIKIARDNPAWVGELRTTLAGMAAWTEEFVQLQLPELDIDQPFRVTAMRVLGDGRGVSLTVESVDTKSYEWDPATEEGDRPAAVLPSSGYTIAAPANVSVVVRRDPLTAALADANYTAQVLWDPPVRDDLEHEVQFRNYQVTAWQTLMAPEGVNTATTAILPYGNSYLFRARVLTATGAAGDWSSEIRRWVDSTAAGAPEAPSGVSASSPSAGQIKVDWTNDAETGYADVFVNSTNSFSSATLVATREEASLLGGAETVTFDYTAGSWYVWVRAYDGLGVPTSEVQAAGSPVTVS